MRLVKRLILLTLCLCMAASSACAMGLNVQWNENSWDMNVSWSSRLNVAKIILYTGANNNTYSISLVKGGTSVTVKGVAPLGTYSVRAYDASGNEVARGGEVTGDVEKWGKYGSTIGIFEIVRRTNSDTSESLWNVEHPTVSSITSDQLNKYLDQGIHFYLHWKVQFKQQSYAQTLKTDLVMRTPSGALYHDSWDTSLNKDLGANGYWNCYPCISGFDDVLDQYRCDYKTWEKGTYTFRLYADGKFMKDGTLTIK